MESSSSSSEILCSMREPGPPEPQEKALQMCCLLNALLSDLAGMNENEVGNAVEKGLKMFGEFLDVERSYIFLFHEEDGELFMSNTYEWCSPGVSSEKARLQSIRCDMFPPVMDSFRSGEMVNIPRVRDLPEKSDLLRTLLKAQGVRSALMMPLITACGALSGFLGFDAVHEERVWEENVLSMLRLLSRIFAGAFERWERIAKLRELNQSLERRIAESTAELRFAYERYDRLIYHAQEIIAKVNALTLEIEFVNPVGLEKLGYALNEVICDPTVVERLIHPDSMEHMREIVHKIRSGRYERLSGVVLSWVAKNGERLDWEHTIIPLKDRAGKVTAFESIARDITEQLRMERMLRYRATHDSLTDLLNRQSFEECMSALLKRVRRTGGMFAVAMIDLDNFKTVNDVFGHAAGDDVLRKAARLLLISVRESDVVARFGGDEFVVLFESISSRRDAELLLQRVLDALIIKCGDSERSVRVTGSAGYALFPADASGCDELLRYADEAMYTQKMLRKSSSVSS